MASPAFERPVFHAKDPGGLTSQQTAYHEPGGRRSLGEIPLRRSHEDKGLMSLLLAAPPPPPPSNTPPDRSKSQSTPRQRIRTPLATKPSESRSIESYDTWDYIKHQKSLPSVVATHSDDFTVSTIASPRHAIIAERLRAARAIYQSDTLVLDAVQEESKDILPATSSVTVTTTTTASRSTPSRMSPTESDNSDSTEMMGNHSSYEVEEAVTPKRRLKKIRTPERVRVRLERAKSNEKEKRPKTPTRLRLALRPKKIVETSPQKTTHKRRTKIRSETVKPPDVEKSSSDDSAAPKQGFFGKLFRTGKKKNTKQVQNSSDDTTLLTEMGSQTTAPTKQSNSEDEDSDKENSKEDTHVRKTGNSSGGNRDALHRGRSVLYYGHDEVSTLTAPTFESLGRRSLDPEAGASVCSQKTHEPSGRYLQSKKELEIDTVATLDDPPEKDDSPMTINSRRTSIDPADDTPRIRGSEPRESRTRTQSFRDPSPKNVLRSLNDPSPTETAEEIPFDFQDSPSNQSARSSPYHHHLDDPQGGSPLHHLRGRSASQSLAPDPPQDSVEESEDDKELNMKSVSNNVSVISTNCHRPPVVPLPPPPPQRQNSSNRSVCIQSPTNNSGNVQVRSPHHRVAGESPRGILRTTGTEPIDSDLILEQSMEDGIFEDNEDNKRALKEGKNMQLTMLTAARFNAKTMAYLHTLNGDPSPSRCWSHVYESDGDGTPRHVGLLEDDLSEIIHAPRKQQGALPRQPSESRFAAHNQKFKNRPRSRKQKKPVAMSKHKRSGPRTTTPFSVGANILRKEREQGIASGKYERITPKKRGSKVEARVYSEKNEWKEPKDPIQRAGRRLLSKSAVPIQSAARRFLAQREAIDRMWGILEIQCYMRRLKAEATLLAYRSSAVTIQSVFRGSQVRKALEEQNEAAVEIQKIIRGYLACVSTFDTVYRIIVIQSHIRGYLVRSKMRRFEEKCREYSATKIQQWWRCVSCQQQYQYFIVDVLIIQSAFRRWRAQREYKAIMDFRRTEAAKRIQAAWRGFQSYSDYIFSLVDIIVVQRTARRWLAMRKVKQMRRDKAATQIQSQFRKYSAQYKLLLSLMNTILIQSIMRMCLAKNLLARKRASQCTEEIAATKIQAAWRGFATFTDYIITQYHIVKIQSVFRGLLVRKQAHLRLGSIIMIQSHCRKFLVAEKIRRLQAFRIVTGGQLGAMREMSAANRIQFWWRVVLDCRREKHAALVIERFFLMVKREVDMEIARVQRRKTEKRRRKEDKFTLGTVDEDTSDFCPTSFSTTKSNRKSKYLSFSSSPHSRALRHDKNSESIQSTDSLNFTYSADGSEMSGTVSSLPKSYQHETQRTTGHKASEKYASLYGIRTKKSIESQQKKHYLAESIENTLSSGSSIQGIQFATSPGSSFGALSPLGSPSGLTGKQYYGSKNVKHFDFDVNPEDEFGLI